MVRDRQHGPVIELNRIQVNPLVTSASNYVVSFVVRKYTVTFIYRKREDCTKQFQKLKKHFHHFKECLDDTDASDTHINSFPFLFFIKCSPLYNSSTTCLLY